MKIALFLLSTIAATSTAFVANKPFATSTFRANSIVGHLNAEEEDGSETEESTFKGAEAISALTSGVEDVFSVEDIAKILPHVRLQCLNLVTNIPFLCV